MEPMEYALRYGSKQCKKVSEKAGIGYEYFKQIAHGRRRASPDAAARLAKASGNRITVRDLAVSTEEQKARREKYRGVRIPLFGSE